MKLISALVNRAALGPRCALVGVVVAVLVGALIAGAMGCDLRGVPLPGTQDAALSPEDEAEIICEASTRVCNGTLVEVCNERGTELEFIECPASTSCEAGECKTIDTRCSTEDEEEDTEALRHFSVRPRELVFETDEQLKSSTASLHITNCSNYSITLKELGIHDPNRIGNNRVFEFADRVSQNDPENLNLELAAGDTRTFKIRYKPQYAFSRETGKLNVEILARRYHNFHVDLIPKAHCVTATPEIDLGLVTKGAVRHAFVQNCGSEPVQIDGVRVAERSSESPVRLELEPGFTPSTLQPGESQAVRFSAEKNGDGAVGEFDAELLFDLHEPEKYPGALTTSVTGHLVPESCRDGALVAPTVWTAQTEEAEGWHHVVSLGERVHIQTNQPSSEDVFFKLEAPHGSRSRLEEAISDIVDPTRASFVTDVAGTYTVEINQLDETGTALCDAPARGDDQELPELTIEVRPTSALYVDLQWVTEDDTIPYDIGYGRGADLNLHMSALDVLSESTELSSPEFGCFGYGEYPLPQTLAGLPAADIADCASTGAELHSLSVSGARREIMTVDDADRRYYYIGVSAFSVYEFPRAFFRLSVYADGEPVENIELHEPWWSEEEQESLPESLHELLTYTLGGEEVWVFGVWDAQENKLLPRPPRRFPRPFP